MPRHRHVPEEEDDASGALPVIDVTAHVVVAVADERELGVAPRLHQAIVDRPCDVAKQVLHGRHVLLLQILAPTSGRVFIKYRKLPIRLRYSAWIA